jgi:hypothetical protein
MAYVYRHIRVDKNEPFYIGIGSDSIYRRAKTRDGRNKIWKGIVKRSNFEVDILFDDISFDEAKQKEIEFISLYGRIDKGTGTLCNLTDGGEGMLGAIVSEETRLKRSIANKGNKSRTGQKLSDEQKAKLSAIHKGKKKIYTKEGYEAFLKAREKTKGRKQPQEEIERRRLSNTGKKRSEEFKQRMREANLGKKMSEEARKKMSEYWTGRKRKPYSEETRRKISEAQQKLSLIRKIKKTNMITLSQEQLRDLEILLLETPFKYAQPILNILQKAAQEQAPKEEVKAD